MSTFELNRESAFAILGEQVQNENLIRHALAVEAVMGHFAEYFGEQDVLKWRIIGLLHDIDYEKYPDRHCFMVRDILEPYGFPEEYLRAIESHGYKLVNDVELLHTMEKVLYATDELTGLIAATALLRPGKSILDLNAKSVQKKWKQKGFAAGVNRDVITDGAAMLGMEINTLTEHTIRGMQAVAEEIGLKGEL